MLERSPLQARLLHNWLRTQCAESVRFDFEDPGVATMPWSRVRAVRWSSFFNMIYSRGSEVKDRFFHFIAVVLTVFAVVLAAAPVVDAQDSTSGPDGEPADRVPRFDITPSGDWTGKPFYDL